MHETLTKAEVIELDEPQWQAFKLTLQVLKRERNKYESKFAHFVRAAWHVVEPTRELVWNWHLTLLCRYMEAVHNRTIKRLIVNIPYRTTKSTIVGVMYPAWVWAQDPSHQFLTLAHSDDLATRDAQASRALILSDWYRQYWGSTYSLAGDQNTKHWYQTTAKGHRSALGLSAGVTGKSADTILIDDPHDQERAQSDAYRQSALAAYDQKVANRLNDPVSGAVVLIMQRLHELDLTGHLVAGEEPWEHVILPMEYEGPRYSGLHNDPRTQIGELLDPIRFPPDIVRAHKSRLGTYGSAGQLQQRPSPEGGGILKKSWWRQWPTGKAMPEPVHTIQSWDTAFSEKDHEANSYSARTTWGIFVDEQTGRHCMMLLERWRDHVGYPELRKEAQKAWMDWKPDRVLIEKKASGQCYDDETEVLTRSGWKPFYAVDIATDEFATRSREGVFEWQKATAETHEDYKGPMRQFLGKTHDLLVTPNHRMLVCSIPKAMGGHPSTRQRGEPAFITADDLAKYGGEKTKTPLISTWYGEEIISKALAPDEMEYPKAGNVPSILTVSGDDYIKFMAMYLAEGWTQHTNRYYGVHIGQYESSPAFNEFYAVAGRVGNAGTRRGKEIYLTNRRLYEFVRQYGTKCDQKVIPRDIMEATSRQLRLFWDYYMMGDGHIAAGGQQVITTTSRAMADQLQEIAQKIGYSASVSERAPPPRPHKIAGNQHETCNFRPSYVVRLRTSKTQRLAYWRTVTYEGEIHCVQVPNEVLYVRRNGYPSWCGNSLIQDLRRAGIPVSTYQPDRDKIARAYAVSAMLESGQIYRPDRKWVDDVIEECAVFPAGAHSDLVDTCTQAWLWLRNGWWVQHPEDPKDEVTKQRKRKAAYG